MLSEIPATTATCFGPAGVSTRPTMSGGKSACICRGSLSVWYFHSSFIPFTFETVRMCSFFCQAVRCGSPPSVSQSAIAGGDWVIGDWATGDWAIEAAADKATVAAANAMYLLTLYFPLSTFYFL